MATTQIKDGYNGGSDNQMKVNADGSINVNTSGGGGTTSTNLTEVGGAAIAEGQTTMANSLPVVIASNQSPINVVTSGTSTVSGTVSTVEDPLANFQTSQYSVGATPVQITPTPLADRSSISLRVTTIAGNAIFIGTSASVSITTGYPLYNGDTIQMDLSPTNSIWAISGASGQTMYALEMS
jgi:hypothetical protein